MAEPVTVPSTPDPQITAIIAMFIRVILMIAGAVGVSAPFLAKFNDTFITLIAGAIALVAAISWSIYEQFRQAQIRHATAVASARAGQARQYEDYKDVKAAVKMSVIKGV